MQEVFQTSDDPIFADARHRLGLSDLNAPRTSRIQWILPGSLSSSENVIGACHDIKPETRRTNNLLFWIVLVCARHTVRVLCRCVVFRISCYRIHI